MHLIRTSSLATFLCVMLLIGATAYAQFDGYAINGKLIPPSAGFSCDRCEVHLEINGMPVATAYSDAAGNFVFTDLRPGSYVVKVNLQGFEAVEQRVEVSNLFQSTTIIMLTPKVAENGESASDNVVHIASYLKQYPEKAVALYKQADKNARKGNHDEAIKQLEEALQIAPDFYHAHNYLGLLYRSTGRLDEAEQAFQTARELNDSSPEPLINLSGLYVDRGEPERAIEVGQEAVKRDKRSAPAFFNLGVAFFRASKFLLAQEALQNALNLAPKMGAARLALANVFAQLRNLSGLREQLTLFLRENPKAKERDEVKKYLSELPAEEPAK